MMARVLIVEDDQIIATDLRLKLQRLGHDVVGIASTGEEAIAIAAQSKPELVLMDVQLETALNGIDAAGVIQARTGASILFVTAFSAAVLRDKLPGLAERGICLNKPFSRVQFEAAVDAALGRRSGRASSS
jgi:DNA-binding response OmpR family regulator